MYSEKPTTSSCHNKYACNCQKEIWKFNVFSWWPWLMDSGLTTSHVWIWREGMPRVETVPMLFTVKILKSKLHQVHQENHFLGKIHKAVYEHMEFHLKIHGSGLCWRFLTLVVWQRKSCCSTTSIQSQLHTVHLSTFIHFYTQTNSQPHRSMQTENHKNKALLKQTQAPPTCSPLWLIRLIAI